MSVKTHWKKLGPTEAEGDRERLNTHTHTPMQVCAHTHMHTHTRTHTPRQLCSQRIATSTPLCSELHQALGGGVGSGPEANC